MYGHVHTAPHTIDRAVQTEPNRTDHQDDNCQHCNKSNIVSGHQRKTLGRGPIYLSRLGCTDHPNHRPDRPERPKQHTKKIGNKAISNKVNRKSLSIVKVYHL